ncbi:peroxisomal biogenesis factor 11 [Phlyctochytrium arcticum]|nr:peroxisomal biogenesis factor 11 [Phlyctochytrium arcticum]
MDLTKPNPTLDKLVRLLSTVKGTDKVFMIIQYTSKILLWHLRRSNPSSTFAQRIVNLATPLADVRVLLRYYGLLPMIQYIKASERQPSPSAKTQLLTRLMNASMIIYYPLEHAYWLSLHQIIPMKVETRNKVGIWSCRFWAAYVVLNFAQLWEQNVQLNKRERALVKQHKLKQGGDVATEAKEVATYRKERQVLAKQRQGLALDTVINAAYFPLTVHWSLENSSFPDVGVGICGTIAALAQTYTAWQGA